MKLSAQKLFVLCACAFFANMPLTSTSRADTTTGAAAMQPGTLPDFSVMVKGLSPSVVNVAVDGTAPRVEGDSTEREKEEGEKEKKDAEVPPFKSVGSGFIVDESGLIFTNYHVIGEAKFATVRLLDDKNEYRATIVGKDQKTDLALLKITPKGPLTVAKLGDSDVVEVGQWVLAIGNQFQLGQTVTAGIISAKSRKVPSRGSPYDSFLQTDASINPGSSGGPLFNTRGEVVGINSAIFSPGRSLLGGSGFNIGIGFAIPVNLAKSVLVQLKTNGRVSRGLLGVLLQQVDSAVAEALELPSADGALIADVLPETPAAKAGFKKFDVVTKFGDHAIRDFDDLPVLVAGTPNWIEGRSAVVSEQAPDDFDRSD